MKKSISTLNRRRVAFSNTTFSLSRTPPTQRGPLTRRFAPTSPRKRGEVGLGARL
jgi:hypothetical protein